MEASQSGEGQAPPEGTDQQGPAEGQEGSGTDQAPEATEQEEVIEGDPGFGEQQPVQNEGSPSNVDRPHATSGPPPSAQSGVPLAEDRAAGVEPGPEAGGPSADPSGAAAEGQPAEEQEDALGGAEDEELPHEGI